MISFTDVLHDLVRRGLSLRIDQDGNLFIYDPQPAAQGAAAAAKPQAKAAPAANAAKQATKPAAAVDMMAVRHAAALAARCRRPPLPEAGMPLPTPPGPHWRGISWQDVPGHDAHTKKLNFSLLRRGLLSGYKSCAGLEGAALKQELLDLSDRNRHNSRTHAARHRNRGKPTPGPTPP